MASETFVDTSGFYALLAERDEMHERAARILRQAEHRRATFVTTDYVLDETVTLLVPVASGIWWMTSFSPPCARSVRRRMDESRNVCPGRGLHGKHIDQRVVLHRLCEFSGHEGPSIAGGAHKDEHFERRPGSKRSFGMVDESGTFALPRVSAGVGLLS